MEIQTLLIVVAGLLVLAVAASTVSAMSTAENFKEGRYGTQITTDKARNKIKTAAPFRAAAVFVPHRGIDRFAENGSLCRMQSGFVFLIPA